MTADALRAPLPAPPLAPLLTLPGPGDRRPRVGIVTGGYGAGHDAAARALARVVEDAGCEAEVHDVVDLIPWRLGPVLRSLYYAQLRRQPGSWSTTLRLLEPGRRLHRLVTRLLAACARPVVAAVAECDLVLTTHPFGAQALGHGRSAGDLAAPIVTYFCDTSVHALWLHPGVDLNLAIHRVAAEDAARWGAAATVVNPMVRRRPCGASPAEAMASLGVHGPRVLVTGGSLGMGDLEATCRDLLAATAMTPVVLCGTDAGLRARLRGIPGVVALGWRDDVPALMEASDCIVQNAGGFTSLEALASGTPVVTYRPLPGHGIENSRNLERAGLVPWARDVDELAVLVAAAAAAPRVDRLPTGAPDVLSVLTGAADRTGPHADPLADPVPGPLTGPRAA